VCFLGQRWLRHAGPPSQASQRAGLPRNLHPMVGRSIVEVGGTQSSSMLKNIGAATPNSRSYGSRPGSPAAGAEAQLQLLEVLP